MSLTIALLVASLSASLPDGGTAQDAPIVTRLSDGRGFLFSPAAFDAVNAEMKRLQDAEKQAKVEKERKQPWVEVILISAAVGLAVGIPGGFLIGRALPR
jgi:hypothetical protein